MPTKRAILAELTADELRTSISKYELQVGDRRVRAQLIDALAHARKARIDEILQRLPRERLKELCRSFDLDDSGRKKADITARLLGPAATPKNADDVEAPAKSAAAATPDPSAHLLSFAQLKQYLWSAADILRGSIDSSDYKSFILGLLFVKRLSDRFEEEAEKLIAGGMPEEVAWTDTDEHQFFVPNRARWSTIQKQANNIGEALNKACAALEEQNGSLEGVLGGIDYNDEQKLGNGKSRDTVLARLVQHFSQLSLRNEHMAEPDLLGRAYEYLIEQFADDAGKKGGEFYTPRMVVRLIVELLAPTEQMRICDPTAGSGGMLIECAHYIERKGGNPGKASEMEHAIRHEINVRLEENPAFYESLRERLEAIIEQRRQQQVDAAKQLSLLSSLRDELKGEESKAEDLGLNPRGYAIYGLLEQRQSSLGDGLVGPDNGALSEIASTIDEVIEPFTELVDWHQKDDVQRQMRSRIKGELRAHGVEQEAMESLAANILDLAKVRSHR